MESEKRIGHILKEVNNLMIRSMKGEGCEHEKCDHSSIMQLWISEYIIANKDKNVFQKDIQEAFSIRKPTATNILQTMEKNGLIIRTPLKEDGRCKKITATPLAQENHNSMQKRIISLEDKLTDGLTEEEIVSFFNIMEKIKNNLQK